MFSEQTGAQSGRVSTKVTKELLKIKDKLSVVVDTYENTNEIVIRRNSNRSNYQGKN